MSQCQHIKGDGEQCGAQALSDGDYCRHHIDSEKVVEAEGKDADTIEGKAIDALCEVIDEARGSGNKCRAAEALLKHERERDS